MRTCLKKQQQKFKTQDCMRWALIERGISKDGLKLSWMTGKGLSSRSAVETGDLLLLCGEDAGCAEKIAEEEFPQEGWC